MKSLQLIWKSGNCKSRVSSKCDQNITMATHERHVVSDHRLFHCLFNSLCGPTSRKHRSPHYRPFVRGIHRWPANSPHEGPVTWKMCLFDDVVINVRPSSDLTTWQGTRLMVPPTTVRRHAWLIYRISAPAHKTCLLLLISMLWHRQAIFESKGDKLSSSAECRIRTWKSQDTYSYFNTCPQDMLI